MSILSLPHSEQRGGDDSEKSFWISFADLMTALMVLFLLVMTVAMLALTNATREEQTQKSKRAEDVTRVMNEIAKAAKGFDGMTVDQGRHLIDFGDRARFDTGSHALGPDAVRRLREFLPKLLAAVDTEAGQKWVRRVIVEGFADPRGSYLMNLNLSMQRGQRVLCVLLDPAGAGDGIGMAERLRVRDLFAVGGYSFNAPRESYEASRRIEFRIEFRELGGNVTEHASPSAQGLNVGDCALGR